MMTTLQSKECGKGPKKTFAPPAQKLHSLMPYNLNSSKEEILGISSPEAETRPSLLKARLEKKKKKTTKENGTSSGQEIKGKAQDSKKAEKKEKGKSTLTNAEFEEIVQIVLQKSLQECLENEKMEKAQSGHEHRQKDQLKKTVQDHSQIRDQQKGEGSGFGQCLVWVQCSSPNCEKWRRLRGNIDPSVLPDNWSCDQNTDFHLMRLFPSLHSSSPLADLEYNHCDIPEETWTGHENEVAYASYIPGSIIWAKQYGYPWWPGMVESDPDLGEYFLFASHLDSLPKKCKNKDFSQKLGAALMMAQEAEQISIQERVNLFGFWSRYSGSDYSGEGKDVMLSGANSLDSCLEKEEEESEVEEEEEEQQKKDPTLPGPKPAKIQTKKPKARGGAHGRDGTPQRKTMKRSLGNESAAPSLPIMGRKKGHGNSEPEQPGPKKKFKAPQSKAPVSSSSEEKEARIVPEVLTPPAPPGACPVVGKKGPAPQEPWPQEAGSVLSDDGASSDLDLDQLMEDVGEELEQREEPQHRDDAGELAVTFCEE
ncbi:zinc finger CW-type PWWP domain protein 1 isoform X3 [Globicephala melas]|uniref:zinc finger CW-type PWWP domain protein 1 isoform X3 n=1 Tax=Globicephala melas TaxID=9731 RepID=UPI00293D8F9E|nr:zinc finger CW-type PWWP domain protein 1 isoform X3 [Globicephala melas]